MPQIQHLSRDEKRALPETLNELTKLVQLVSKLTEREQIILTRAFLATAEAYLYGQGVIWEGLQQLRTTLLARDGNYDRD
jgi:hypothetical protein